MNRISTRRALTRDDLTAYFHRGIKRKTDLKVGVEWEKIGVYRENGEAIRYSGPRGVLAIFRSLIQKFHWQPVYSGKSIIGLKKGWSAISLEPGGQIELSGHKAAYLEQNARELFTHLTELKDISEPLGIVWLGIGMQPVSRLDAIEWVPKERYGLMRRLLRHKGSQTFNMMKQTASIQISLDYTSEEDAIEKMRAAMGLSPILTSIFANSPISEGRLNGFRSRRTYVWRHTAPERTGIIPPLFTEPFGFRDYAHYACKVPMLFIVRNGRWLPIRGLDFDGFMARGWRGHQATLEDWALHLTTLFTDVRLKQYIEIRGIDCQKKAFGLAAPALLKGLLYDSENLRKTWALVSDLSVEERLHLATEAGRRGLDVRFRGKPLQKTALKIIGWAEKGLSRLAQRRLAKPNESEFLVLLKEMVEMKRTPADFLIDCFKEAHSQNERIRRIIGCASI